jgi:hypothetical protein
MHNCNYPVINFQFTCSPEKLQKHQKLITSATSMRFAKQLSLIFKSNIYEKSSFERR